MEIIESINTLLLLPIWYTLASIRKELLDVRKKTDAANIEIARLQEKINIQSTYNNVNH